MVVEQVVGEGVMGAAAVVVEMEMVVVVMVMVVEEVMAATHQAVATGMGEGVMGAAAAVAEMEMVVVAMVVVVVEVMAATQVVASVGASVVLAAMVTMVAVMDMALPAGRWNSEVRSLMPCIWRLQGSRAVFPIPQSVRSELRIHWDTVLRFPGGCCLARSRRPQ